MKADVYPSQGATERLIVRALKAVQGGVDVFSFYSFGPDVMRIADISRISRDGNFLHGFQRREVRAHVKSIIDFLNRGPVLFPNAIILALFPDVTFRFSRGPRPEGTTMTADTGTLVLPVRNESERAAWIVDGQQRSLALSRAEGAKLLAVPVIGFIASDLAMQREQFILVNKAKPLPTRLIDELLPEIGTELPRDLAARRLPSELCNVLSRDPHSPFYGLIRRESDGPDARGVIVDTALAEAIRRNLRGHTGALRPYCQPGSGQGRAGDTSAMLRALVLYWGVVRDTFPDAWGRPPTESRLTHSAGIRAMGMLMDPIMLRADSSPYPEVEIRASLARLAPYCHWTEGAWDGLGWRWNEVQSTPQHITRLGEHLAHLDRDLSRRPAASR